MPPAGPAGPLVDGFGRVVRDLRVSVTDRCPFRCTYCMPAEGMTWLPRDELLTFEEIEQVVATLVHRSGLRSVRLTGGEPTVRARLPVLVERLARLGVDLSMTTNGATLALVAHDLAAAGLTRVNISCDSLRRDRFAAMTGRDALPQVLQGIDAALDAGLQPVKLNCVVVRGVNDDEVVDIAAFGRDRGVEVRFIEAMPLDAQGAWRAEQVVPAAEILATLDAAFGLQPRSAPSPAGGAPDPAPAARHAYADGLGHVGVIASVTQPFCGDCDRIRLTADGQLRTCLFSPDDEADLRAILRSGHPDDEVADRIHAAVASAVAGKWAGHAIGTVRFVKPARGMSQIGG